MASPSPLCTVADAAGAPVAQANGVNVTAGHVITVALASSAGCNVWELTCVGTDDQHSIATINAGLTVNQATKTATFTAPSEACAIRFQSRVNRGLDANFSPSALLTTTFGVYVPLAAGARLGALGETTEGSTAFGWTSNVNNALRTVASAGLNPRGTYSSGTTYALNDFIVSSGVAYRALGATTGNAPPNVTYWEPYSSAGGLPGVTLSGTGTAGQVTTLTSPTTAIWATATGIPQNAVTVYSAVNDGVTDNASTFSTASASVTANGRLYLPPGGYVINTSMTFNCAVDFATGAYLLIASGQTVTFNGAVHADDYQWIFRGAGVVTIQANGRCPSTWWGADWTGVVDSSPYIQAAIASSIRTTRVNTFYGAGSYPYTVYAPAGLYKMLKPVSMATGCTYEGEGPLASVHTRFNRLYPLFVVSPPQGGLPTSASLATGSGNAYNLDWAGDPTALPSPFTGSPRTNYLLPGFESTAMDYGLVGRNVITIHFFYQCPTIPVSGAISIFNIGGSRTSDEGTTSAISLLLQTSGKLNINFQPIGGTGFFVGDHPTVLTPGTIYYVEFTYDGATTGKANLFVGVKGASTGAPYTANVTGTFNVLRYSMLSIGAMVQYYPDGPSGYATAGKIDSFEVKSTYDHSAAFTTPTAKHTFGANTLFGTNFELDGPNNEFVACYQVSTTINCYTVTRYGDRSIGAQFAGNITLRNFGTDGGIYCQLATHLTCENLSIGQGSYGLWYNNNCYEAKIANVNCVSTASFGIAFANGGVVSCQDSSATSSGFAFLAIDSGAAFTNFYGVSSYVGALFRAGGSDMIIDASLMVLTDEARVTQDYSILIEGNMGFHAAGCVLETVDVRHTNALVGIAGTAGMGRYKFTACLFNAGVQLKHRFKFLSPTPRRDCVVIDTPHQVFGTPGCPSWTNGHDECIIPVGWARGITSCLATCNNLSGTVKLVGGSGATVAVTFDVAEADAGYQVSIHPCAVISGAPAAGSLAAYPASRTTTGFTLTAGADPGAGCTIQYLWTVTRTRLGPAPTITTNSVTTVRTVGGTSMTLTGTGFDTVVTPKVYVGGGIVSAYGATSATSIACTTGGTLPDSQASPAYYSGLCWVTVVNSDGQSAVAPLQVNSIPAPFLIAVTPSSGTAAGGTALTLAGTGFVSPITNVTFGATVVTTGITFVNANQITLNSPAHAAGAVSVTVQNPDGQVSNAQTYTFV